MIFSIILIIAFLGVAIFVIYKFIIIGRCVDAGFVKEDLQKPINDAWASDKYSGTVELDLPSGLDYVCFVDISKEGKGEHSEYYLELKEYGYGTTNMFFYPLDKACEGQESYRIEHINVTEITKNQNPYCVGKINGKVNINLEKGYYDSVVQVS
jgi:hypothetical protein